MSVLSPLARGYWRLVKFGFRLLYHEMAFTYDAVSWIVSLGEWRRWGRSTLKHLNAPPGTTILELAHGTANLQLDLRSLGYRTIGLDFSPQMGQIARRKFANVGLRPDLVRARAQALPFPAESFVTLVSTFPTEFIVDPPTIGEVYRVLRPGGRLVFVPNGMLTTNGTVEQGLEFAYRATGQRSGWPERVWERFDAAGFRLTHLTETYERSLAYVVIAEKLDV